MSGATARNFQASERQESEDNASSAHAGPAHAPNENPIGRNDDDPWSKFNLLSLDGGGIRGLWTLFALERLMQFVARKEEKDGGIHHSFYPEELPNNISQIPLTEDERNRHADAEGDEERLQQVPEARRYLPCHYFDTICGSSTGALIAIMLGRFRMTVPDCINEYEKFGQKVFGNPRFFTPLHFGVGKRHKYDATSLEGVIKDVTKRRNEKPNGETFGKITFPSRRGLCTTFVTTKKSQINGSSGTPYLIRSYDHEVHRSPSQSRLSTPASTFAINRNNTNTTANRGPRVRPTRRVNSSGVNYERAQEFEIWQVARAATAAPFYFEPLKIERARTNGYIYFTDGGFGRANNPTREGKREIEDLRGRNSIGIIVSVGTARATQTKGQGWLKRIPWAMKDMANEISDPEATHKSIEQESQDFPYFRINDPEGVHIELDQWKPKKSMLTKNPGTRTIQSIRNAFDQWAGKPANIEQLQDCAEMLVQCRRRRMVTTKWELYATGARYRCCFKGCGDLEKFSDRVKMAKHLSEDHVMEKQECEKELENCRNDFWRYQAAVSSHKA